MCLPSSYEALLELKLILCLRVLRTEFQGFLEVLDRALLVAFGVFRLRHRLISARRLRVVLQIGLQNETENRRSVCSLALHSYTSISAVYVHKFDAQSEKCAS